MKMRLVQSVLLVTLGIGAGLSACAREDPRLENLTAGITKDSAQAVMGMERPRRIDPFLVNGQYIEVMYYARPGASATDSIPDRKLAPVIVINGTLAGWGWKQWDSIAEAHRITTTK